MKFISGIIIGIILVPVGFALYCLSGNFPAAATQPPLPMERPLAGLALNSVISREAPKSVPIQGNETNLAAGARVYRDSCAVCHGLPGQKPTEIASGMSPRPPQLFKGHGVTNDPPGETYWKAKNGIRMTGMPAFESSLSENQLWQVSLLLAEADKLPPSVQQMLAAAPPPAAQSNPPSAPAQGTQR